MTTIIHAFTAADAALQEATRKAVGVTDGAIKWPLPNLEPIDDLTYEKVRSGWFPRAELYLGTVKIGDEWAIARAELVDDLVRPGGGLAVLYFYSGPNKRVQRFRWTKCKHERATGTDSIRGDHQRQCPDCGLTWGWDSSD